jgi:ATP-dependent DNA helicase DinG
MQDYISQVFDHGGLFASRFPGYEAREGQVALARAVDEGMRGGRHVLGEGPCGTGKSIAYAVPAIWHSHVEKKRVVIATANIALQEQLVRKDLPMLAGVLPWKFSFALLKGRNNYLCLSGDTRVLTHDGVRSIGELSGTTAVLLDGDGNWTPSEVRSFGDAPLMKVVLRRGRVEKIVHATMDHRWFTLVARDRTEVVETTTAMLRPGDRLPVAQPRPIARKLRPSPFGIAHGITFGDGTVFGETANGWRTATLVLHGAKKRELLRYFSESHFKSLPLSENGYAEDAVRVCDLPTFFKERPALDEAPSYLYGWLAGYVATDGCVAVSGEITLASANREHLEFVEAVCLRLGIATGPIREIERVGIGQHERTPLYSLPFVAATLSEDFLLRGDHRAHFIAVERARRQRTPWVVVAVECTERVEEVFCAIVPTTRSFVLEGYLVTGNCLDKLAESEARGELHGLFDHDFQGQLDAALAWAETTSTGDVSELPFIPAPQVWSKLSVSSDDCKSDKCQFREQCFSERARMAAQDADIVVTNYHLLFAHIALRQTTGQELVLPPFDLLILDEAHEAADIAREFFGFSLSEHTFLRLASAAAELGNRKLAADLRQEAQTLFEQVGAASRSPRHSRRLCSPGFAAAAGLTRCLQNLIALANAKAEDDSCSNKARATARNVARNAGVACERLNEAVELSDSGKVYWIEVDSKGRPKLRAKRIDVGPLLRTELFDKCPSVSLMSATLTTANTFEFVRRELGVPENSIELVAATPFDFESQALLVVPEQLPDPRAPEFVDAISAVFRDVLDLCDGRTLGLFTSYRNLNAVYERVAGGRHRILRQGDLPRPELTRQFAQDVSSVLLGTESFWMGIDVAGEALTGLVIDKLPFPSPDDPVIEAICERDPRAFDNYLVPRAIIALRQGVGRLIRSKTDFGVVVVLDKRIAEKGYGRRFLASLPRMLSTRRVSNIARFLGEAANARAS